jgi:UV DNA damage endonuclease
MLNQRHKMLNQPHNNSSRLHLGVCCIILPDKNDRGTEFKSTTLSYVQKHPDTAVEKLNQIYIHNLNELKFAINWCFKNQIKLYRISSSLFPLADHPNYEFAFVDFINNNKILFNELSTLLNDFYKKGGRCSIHPDQFVSIGSPKEDVRRNSIRTLEYHGRLFDALGLPRDYSAHINIHLSNGKDPIANKLLPNFTDSIGKLSESVWRRLTFENEDKGFWNPYSIKTYFPTFPIVFDSHHYLINPNKGFSIEEAFEFCYDSWPLGLGIIPVFHHSEGRDGEFDRSHSDYIKNIPQCMYSRPLFLEIEAKQKNIAIRKFKELSEGFIY